MDCVGAEGAGSMIGILRKLSRIGATDGMSEREVNGLVGLNMLILTQTPVGVLCILLIAVYLPATWLMLVVVIIHVVWVSLPPLWRHWRKYLTARVCYGVGAAFFFTLEAALLGAESRFHLLLMIGILAQFYRFPADHRSWSYAMIGVYCLGFIAVEILFPEDGLISAEMPASYMVRQYYFNTAVLLLTVLGSGVLGWLREEPPAGECQYVQIALPRLGEPRPAPAAACPEPIRRPAAE